MEDIKLDSNVLRKIIEDSLPKIIGEKFSSGYGNPINTVIDEEIKNHDGVIRDFIKQTIVSIFSDTQFKEKIASQVIALVIQKGLGK